MKVVIAGSRSIVSQEMVWKAIEATEKFLVAQGGGIIQEVVSGGAHGVDKLGEEWAFEHGVRVVRFNPDWAAHGKAAGPIRNRQMVDYADAVIAIWDGRSRGTKSTIDYAKHKNKPLYIYEARA
jgi:predicted Rossmann-fold nucleotide-binding protein